MRLVVFDVDGTLIDSQAQIVASMEAALAAVGRAPLPRAEVLGIVGLSLPIAVRTLVPDATGAEADAMVAAYKTAFHDLRAAGQVPPLFPGTRAMLDGLAAQDGLALGVATGKSRRGLDMLVEAHGLEALFVTRQVADDHPSKPHPAMLRAALDAAGVAPRDAVMVGDTEFDMEMAHAAGVPAVGVTWGYHDVARLGAADRLIHGWDGLGAALEAVWA